VFDADGIDTAGQAFTFTVRFTGMDGTLHTVRASGVRRREPGSQIGILYDPAAPDDARIADGNATVWLRALVMLAVGAVITYFLLRHG
jgi:hypothetical protein